MVINLVWPRVVVQVYGLVADQPEVPLDFGEEVAVKEFVV
jgi:hypothetical protein